MLPWEPDRLVPTRANTSWGETFLLHAMQVRPHEPMRGPMVLELWFYLKRPKKPQPGAEEYPITGGDWDNLSKGLSDQLNRKMWHDDGQVVDAHVYRRYADREYPEERPYPLGVRAVISSKGGC